MRYSPFLRPFALALLLAGSSPAATLVYNAELDISSSGFGGGQSWVTYFTPVEPFPKLNGTLNPGDQLQITYSAPAGYLFHIFPTPTGDPTATFTFEFWTADAVLNFVSNPAGPVSFSGATAPAPVPFFQSLQTGEQNEFVAYHYFRHVDFSFKSITGTFTMPSGYSRTFTDFTPAIVLMTASYTSASNLGPAAILVRDNSSEIPEPAPALLIPGVLALLALGKRASSGANHHRQSTESAPRS